MNSKIFISHSSKDVTIVDAFVEHVLRLGLDIPSERIFCTSMEGHGVKSGEYIPDRLRVEIKGAAVALLLISKNYKSSEVCLNEMGALWVTLSKDNVIPVLLPGVDFDQLGFLVFGRKGVRIDEQTGILKLIQDNKEQLSPTFHLDNLHKQIELFLAKLKEMTSDKKTNDTPTDSAELSDHDDCFEKCLVPFDNIIRKVFPTYNDGVFEVEDLQLQNRLLSEFSRAEFLRDLWFRHAGGDSYVERLSKLPSGNWLMSGFNWEIRISEMWVSMNVENQYEFILIHSEPLDPYQINSDIGGSEYHVGVLDNGAIVSENERLNGYAIIDGETILLSERSVRPQYRESEAHWVFLVTDYHKAGFNPNETIEFCKELDGGQIEVSEESIMQFLSGLQNHPDILKWR